MNKGLKIINPAKQFDAMYWARPDTRPKPEPVETCPSCGMQVAEGVMHRDAF